MGANTSTDTGPRPIVPQVADLKPKNGQGGLSNNTLQPTPTLQDQSLLKRLPHFKDKVSLRDFDAIRTV